MANKKLLLSTRIQVNVCKACNKDCGVFLRFLQRRSLTLHDYLKRLGTIEVNNAAFAVQQVACDTVRRVDCINKSLSENEANV